LHPAVELVDAAPGIDPRRVDAAVPTDLRRKSLDWAVLVVLLALGCTLGWIFLLLWGAVRAFQIALL